MAKQADIRDFLRGSANSNQQSASGGTSQTGPKRIKLVLKKEMPPTDKSEAGTGTSKEPNPTTPNPPNVTDDEEQVQKRVAKLNQEVRELKEAVEEKKKLRAQEDKLWAVIAEEVDEENLQRFIDHAGNEVHHMVQLYRNAYAIAEALLFPEL